MPITPEQARAELARRELARRESGNDSQAQGNPLATAGMVAGGVAGAGALGAGIYGAGRFINTPNRLMKPIDAQLQTIANNLSPNAQVSTSDLPDLLSKQYSAKKASITKPQNIDFSGQATEIKNSRIAFDQNVVNPAIEDAAKHIAANYKPSLDSTYQNYRAMLSGVENGIQASGQQLQSGDIQNLLNKTISDAIQKGVPEEKLGMLHRLASSFENKEGGILDLQGKPMDISKPIPFEQIKGNVNFLADKLPDQAKYALSDNWGNFIKQYLPQDQLDNFNAMQGKYGAFAQQRNALFDLIDRDSGIFDTKKLVSRMKSYARTGTDAGLTDLLKTFSQGTDITKPINGLSDKLSVLENLANQRTSYQSHLDLLDKAKKAHSQLTSQVEQQLQKAQQEYANISQRTANLLSQKNAIMEKFPIRTMITKSPELAVKVLSKVTGIGRGLLAGAPIGAVQNEMMTRGAGYDPAEAFKDWYTNNFGSATEKQKMIEDLQKKAQDAMQI